MDVLNSEALSGPHLRATDYGMRNIGSGFGNSVSNEPSRPRHHFDSDFSHGAQGTCRNMGQDHLCQASVDQVKILSRSQH